MSKYDNAKGLIFNIVHGSFVDGWGIRTTIFLKGCPLRCVWCCNPEGQSFEPELRIICSHCNGCGRCVPICPNHALTVKNDIVVVDRSVCNGCGDCVDACWYGALDIFGKTYTVSQMFEIIKKDIQFYKNSDGGLTIGGGEATCYPEFCLGMIENCHNAGITVAIDTCGYVPSELGKEVLRQADLILFDIKGLNSELHQRNTGRPNATIWAVLDQLDQLKKDVIIRVPVITGYNDDEAELGKTAERLSHYKCIKRVDILPVHEYGKSKYEELDREYLVNGIEKTTPERQKNIYQMFASHGLATQIGG